MTTFDKWLDTYIEEARIDPEEVFTVEGPSGENYIPVGVLIEHIKMAPAKEQKAIQHGIVRLDFANANVRDYLRHLAQAIAI